MDLPTGTVTFLFTDVEGSTRLWQNHPAPMRCALARHDALATEVIEEHEGALVKSRGEGDSLFCVFARATDALAAACALQRTFVSETWPAETLLRVRMALHTGEADLRDADYYGSAVNRCARLRAIGHGGQALLSQATEQMVRDGLPEGISLQDRGEHRLRDLQRPEHVFQLLHPDLPADFPPLKSLDALPNNLSQQLTTLIGRGREIAEVKCYLSQTRLVTLTGSGGCGKTRLTLQVAADVLEEYPHGVWLVELASLTDASLVPRTVATALGLREEAGRSLMDTLSHYMKPKALLLVLDNCEHLIEACGQLAEALLRACPSLHILASSRQGLGVAGEQTYRVPSLSLPDPSAWAVHNRQPAVKGSPVSAPSSVLLQSEAVQLFVDRAALGQPTFCVTDQNAPALASVCHRLDGIPLAIELAAARVRAIPVEQIARRLDDRFKLLTGGSRTALQRHQTLRALIDWSYDLLSEQEQVLLRRLSAFAGGWTLEAAEAVCAGDGIEMWDVLDLLASLVDKSLVLYEDQVGQARYRLMETVRQYGRDRLTESGESEAARSRHRDYFLSLAEEAEPYLTGPEQTAWLARLEVEHDNFRAALLWCGQVEGHAEAGLRLASALWRFWSVRGYYSDGQARLLSALAEEGAGWRTSERAKALNRAGTLAAYQGDHAAARALFEESLSLYRELGEKQSLGHPLNNLGHIAFEQGDYTTGRALLEESLAIFQESGDKPGTALALGNLALVPKSQRDYAAARSLFEKSLALYRELGDSHGSAIMLRGLGDIACCQGDYAAARSLLQECLPTFRELGDKQRIAYSLETFASVHSAQAQAERAARLLGAAKALREEIGSPLPPNERAEYEDQVASVRARLGAEAFAAAWAAGRAMTPDEALALAQEAL